MMGGFVWMKEYRKECSRLLIHYPRVRYDVQIREKVGICSWVAQVETWSTAWEERYREQRNLAIMEEDVI